MTDSKEMIKNTQPLSFFRSGAAIKVTAVDGGKNARKKLFDLGILPGVRLEVIQGSPGFPFIMRVGESRIMLGWGMVQKILAIPAE